MLVQKNYPVVSVYCVSKRIGLAHHAMEEHDLISCCVMHPEARWTLE